jgi:uncharacterized membrane protein
MPIALLIVGLLVWWLIQRYLKDSENSSSSRSFTLLSARVAVLEREVERLNARLKSEGAEAPDEAVPNSMSVFGMTPPPIPGLEQEPSKLAATILMPEASPWLRPVANLPEVKAAHGDGVPLTQREEVTDERVDGGGAAGAPVPVPGDAVSNPKIRMPDLNWEQFVGVKLFAWLGGLALFFAAALGLKYSFDHDLVPPALRAAGGFLLGAGLLIGGVVLKRKQYAVTSQTLSATGIVILYAVTFACQTLYHFAFFGPIPTFLLMTLITATAFVVAVQLEAQVVAILGMLGGFLTPVMLSTGEDHPLGLFVYIALLDVGLLGVVLRRRWDYLVPLAAVGTALMQLGWYSKFGAPEKVFVTQAVFLGFPLLFLAASTRAKRLGVVPDLLFLTTSGLALLAMGTGFDVALSSGLLDYPGRGFALGFGGDLILLAIVVLSPRMRVLESVGCGLQFVLLAAWTMVRSNHGLLYWALGLYFAFAILHVFFPFALKGLSREVVPPPPIWSQFIPVAVILLMLFPLLREFTSPWVIWGGIAILDIVAMGLAVVAGAMYGFVAVWLLTLGGAVLWVSGAGAFSVGILSSLMLTGTIAILFFAGSIVVWRSLLRKGTAAGESAPNIGSEWMSLASWMPALSATIPFLLLAILMSQFRPANPSPVFGLGAVLTVLILGMARISRAEVLIAVALASVGLLEMTWLQTVSQGQTAVIPILWFLGFYGVFMIFPFWFPRDYEASHLPWAISAISGPVHFGLVYVTVHKVYPNSYMGLLPVAFALPTLLGLARLEKSVPQEAPHRMDVMAWFGGVSLFFITLIFPIQFEKEWITIGWALEGVALCWLFHRVPHPGLKGLGAGLLATALIRLTLNPTVFEYHARAGTPILNWYLYTYTAVAACQFLAARLLAPPRNTVLDLNLPPLFAGAGTILLFLLMNIEISDFYSEGTSLTFEFTGSFARDITYTIAWALFALALLLVGIRRGLTVVRYAGLGLLGTALAKLFFHDLFEIGQLYRIGALAVVAVIALVASVLYQRFLGKERIQTSAAAPHETL